MDLLDAIRSALDASLVGQADAKTGLLLAVLAREHAYLEGPPGCGKTRLAEALFSACGKRVVRLRFDRDVRSADLFGGLRLRRSTHGKGERLRREIEEGPLLDAEHVLLDDVDRAPGEALGPLFRLLGDRRLGARSIPLETVVATSATPTEESYADPLEPGVLDRFAIRVGMRGLIASGDLSAARAAMDRWGSKTGRAVDPLELRALQEKTSRLPFDTEVRDLLIAFASSVVRESLDDPWTDRALAGPAVRILRAHALLRGASRVEPRDLVALRLMMGPRLSALERLRLESLLAEVAGEEEPEQIVRASVPRPGAQHGPGGGASTLPKAAAGLATIEVPFEGRSEAGTRVESTAEIKPLLRALQGRIERARTDRGEDPGGQPRGYRPLRALDEALDCDPVDTVLFVEGRLPQWPRTYRRDRKNRGGSLAVLRDVSASMEGRLSRWAGDVVSSVVRAASRRRMRMGYVEFNHEAERYTSSGRFFHRRYGELRALASTRRAEGRTNFEAPLRVALREFGGRKGRDRHVVLLTDGVPVLGDPRVVRARHEARRLGVAVHTVFLGLGDCPLVLDEISRDTGGVRFIGRPDRNGCLRLRPRDEPT